MVWFYLLPKSLFSLRKIRLSIPLWSDFIGHVLVRRAHRRKRWHFSFQSHYGLILSRPVRAGRPAGSQAFNPTMVWFYLETINAVDSGKEFAAFTFNPTMVWFYLRYITRTIKSMNETISLAYATFNPTMVWFYLLQKIVKQKWKLSIPLWSDFISLNRIMSTPSTLIFQSHYGLILSRCRRKLRSGRSLLSIPLWSDFISIQDISSSVYFAYFQSHYGLILSFWQVVRQKK